MSHFSSGGKSSLQLWKLDRHSIIRTSSFRNIFKSPTDKKRVGTFIDPIMEVNAENLTGLSGYLEQTLKPEVQLRKPAEDFLRNVEKQKGYSVLLLTLLNPENNADQTIKVAAAIAFKNFVKRNWKVVSSSNTFLSLIICTFI
jgi:hypothetical protein